MQLFSAQETNMHVTKIARFDWSAVLLAGFVYHIYYQPCLLYKKIAWTCVIVLTQQNSWAYVIVTSVIKCWGRQQWTSLQTVTVRHWELDD